MCAFIVNPPIQDDADYYRRDDDVIAQILGGASRLVIGLRRSGKTSFLYRVRRAARARGIACTYLELADLGDAELAALAEPPPLVLLDEAEVWHGWDDARLAQLVRAIRKSTVVVTCAPQFILELDRERECVQQLVEGFERHVIGPLSDAEARDLLAQAKRPGEGPLAPDQIAELLRTPERLAILLQARGAELAGTSELAVSLGGFGKRILTGLTDDARRVLVDAAHGAPVADGAEARLLAKTGALRKLGAAGRLVIASDLLGELVRKASHRVEAGAGAIVAPPRWELHARIAHLSDLHFGHHAIDAPRRQAERLTAALERDERLPDFFAITGDLSWSGHRRELRDAETFLELLVAWMRERRGWDELECRRRIVVVPGNHEASWSLSRGIPGAGGPPSDDDLEHWVRYSLGPFANFVNRFYRQAVFWDLDEPVLATTFADPSIAFIALSTAHYITEVARDAKFGAHVLERAAALLARDDVARAQFRLGVWHHNLRPFQNQVGAIADVDVAVRDFLRAKPSLDLALHGHVHQGEVEVYRPRGTSQVLTYSAVGSFGVAAHHRPGDDVHGRVYNEFALVELHTSGAGRRMQTDFYELKPDPNGEWMWERARGAEPQLL